MTIDNGSDGFGGTDDRHRRDGDADPRAVGLSAAELSDASANRFDEYADRC